MEDKSLLEKIHSRYIIKNIISYTNNENILLKLILYSKSSQKNLNINFYEYIEDYFNKRIEIKNYLNLHNNCEKSDFKKNKYKKEFEEKLLEINFKKDIILQKIITDYFIKLSKNNSRTYPFYSLDTVNNHYIDFFCPFFDILLKTDLLEKYFTIQISLLTMKEYNSKSEFIANFKKMNKSNLKYSSLYIFFKNLDEIKHLKDLNINFSQLKSLEIEEAVSNCFPFPKEFPQLAKKYETKERTPYLINNLIDTLFPLISISTNLVHLSIKLYFALEITTDKLYFINNFKSLESLKLAKLLFESNFLLKIYSLKHLELIHCKNIEIDEAISSKLKLLNFTFSEINNKKLCFPELEEINLLTKIDLIDLKSLKNLKKFKGKTKEFLKLESPLLEELNCNFDYANSKLIIEKICKYEFLKKIKFELNNINDKELSLIKCKNSSIKEIDVTIYRKGNTDTNLFRFHDIFLNLTDLKIYLNSPFVNEKPEMLSKIMNNSNSKVKNLKIIINNSTGLKVYCQSYETLETLEIEMRDKKNFINKINNTNIIPILDKECPFIFISLKVFKLRISLENIDFDILNNIYNNLDKMPNLIELSLVFSFKTIDENFNNLFLKKVFAMKYIRKIDIDMFEFFSVKCSRNELKKIFPEINFEKFYIIRIYKPKNYHSNKCLLC